MNMEIAAGVFERGPIAGRERVETSVAELPGSHPPDARRSGRCAERAQTRRGLECAGAMATRM